MECSVQAMTLRPLRRDQRPRHATTRSSRRDVNVYYGEKHALKDVDVDIPDRSVMAFIGPSGCGKSTFLRCINRMNDTIPICRVTGKIKIDGQDIYDPAARRRAAARAGRHGVPEAQPVPEVDLRERRLRPAHPRPGQRPRPSSTRSSIDSLDEGRPVEEVKDRLQRVRHRPVRRPAAAPVHRPRHRRQPRRDPDGRAVLGARPDRHRAASRS